MSAGEPAGNPAHREPAIAITKRALRDQLLAARKRMGLAALADAAEAIRAVLLARPEVSRAATVAAYVSVSSEPGTGLLLDALVGAGKRVILPRLMADDDLDWSEYHGSLAPGPKGMLEPQGRLLGREAVGTADLVLVPGLAVDAHGHRLGRGGGSYDRALARVPVGTPVVVLLHSGEVGLSVPVEPHDRSVTAAVTPDGWVSFAG